MIKLQDFAHLQGVTDRQVQRLLKKYAAELDGLYERKGPNGTWLSDEACEILRSKMKQPPAPVIFEEDPRVQNLQAQVEELNRELREANREFRQYATANAALIERASAQIALAEQSEQNQKRAEALEAQNADLRANNEELGQKVAQAEENAQKANAEAWHHYRIALEIYNALPWWKKRRMSAPVPPGEEE